jgi:hypothetical protein
MSWQEKAIEAMQLGYIEASRRTGSARERLEAALRAALPLIEVTPGMINVVAANKLRRLKALGELNKGIDAAIVEDAKLLFTACAEEQTP